MRRLLLLLGSLWLLSSPAYAILGIGDTAIVEDPLNLVQNTATALRTLQSNVNEVTQINNQITQIANEARNLVALPMSMVDQVQQSMSQYTALLQQGQAIAYQAKASVQQFESLYSSGFGGNVSMLQRAQALLGQIRQAGMIATQAQAIYERLCQQQANVGQLMAASQGAVGSLQAQQAGNQLLGVLADQQASLQQVMAATGRLQVGYIMRQTIAEEQAQWNAQQYLQMPVPPDWNTRPSQGITLPE